MVERLAQGVERARADVAVDDAEGPDGEAERRPASWCVRLVRVVGGGRSVAHETCELTVLHGSRRTAVQLRRSRAHNGGETKGVRDAGQYR